MDVDQLIALVRDPSLGRPYLIALAIALGSFVASRLLAALVVRVLRDRVSSQVVLMASRTVSWSLLGLGLATALEQLGIDLSVLVGAAGLLTVAFGFAAQTSASNLVSGVFLLAERPFLVGDVVRIGDVTGEVVAIDTLSVKLRTFDNLLVRLPNETVLKAQITNLTHYPIRRFDLTLRLPFDADQAEVRRLLVALADAHPHCLTEPRPHLFFQQLTDSAVVVQLSVWSTGQEYLKVKDELPPLVLSALRARGWAAAYPRQLVQWEAAPSVTSAPLTRPEPPESAP